MDNRSRGQTELLDRTAVVLSGLCLMHCLMLPLLTAVLPILGQFGEGHLHLQMLFVVLPISLVAFTLGFRRHDNAAIVIGGIVGLTLLAVGGTIAHHHIGIVADRTLTVVGSLVLAIAHYQNSRLSRHAGKISSTTA